ncbi:DUF7507 domain-containing protein [Amycolatopsis nalaikhensis]|uniref:DUF7507 domain-containing protein n=1 Tax=Amycolatopsis nalaikhensis TaxID=715472 RepID=A0ABY8XVT0_9PSEU|nr:hypothetical protein [Amycolatopsis sp. 2-2]WIV59744.1 hypothetical protein QP939_14600 [Amycolatopsis sp. 2-2]
MPLPERPLRLVLVLALVFLASALVPSAGAAAAPPFAVGYDDVVYGDFLYAGNGVLRCPVAADHAPSGGAVATPAACANTADRKDTLANDDFFMQWADVDADPGTFDSASASVTVPPGAKIVFARLNWAGNTAARTCGPREGVPSVPPPGTPAGQHVRLSVGSAKSVDVAPTAFAEDGPYYSAHADVTSQFAGAPTGAPLELTVGNVWAPKGFDCAGGWSIALVYAYPERNPDFAPNKRKIVVDDGHVRQDTGAPPTETTIAGFRAAAADAHIGVTAYDGDWGDSGDQFLVDGTPAAEPATGGTSNFFVANADNAAAPGVKNNFSVDAKSFNVDNVPAGATSAKLTFVTSGDAFLAQNLTFSVPVPELHVALRATQPKTHAGEPVTFAAAVANPGSVPVSGVQVTDDVIPACARPLGTLAPGQTVTFTCTGPAPADDFTNTAKATGTTSLGDPVDGEASARVDVLHPALGMTKSADRPAYRAGETATFTIKVTNTGDTGLRDLRVTDPKTPSCALAGALAPGESRTATCTAKAPIADGVNTANATATDELGKQVTATADAPAPTIAPAIEVTKTAEPPVIHAGDAVTWTVAVRNSGDSSLAPVKVTDDTTTSCSRAFDSLAAGATQTYTCTANPSTTTTSHVTATGTDLAGQPVTATASATVTVITPALTLAKDAAPGVVRAGDPITYTITVTNAGDAPLTEVAVTDDRTPACAKAIGALPPRGRQTYTCTAPAPPDDFTNTAAAEGKDQLGRTVKVTDDAVVDVIHPALAIAARAEPAQVREGDTVTWTVTVTNTGDVPLTAVQLADEQVPGCAKPLGTLEPRATQTRTCTTIAGPAGLTNRPSATGTDPTNRPVTAAAEATFAVQHPAVAVTAEVKGGPFREGDAVPVRITIRNTGDVPLTGLRVTDTQSPAAQPTGREPAGAQGSTPRARSGPQARATGCTQTLDGPLEPGATKDFGCTTTAPADDTTVAVKVTGTPPVGPAVSGEATAHVDVIHPAVAISRTVEPATVRAGDTVTSTITVTNTGDTRLQDASVADQGAPACAKSLGPLEPQATQTYRCTQVAGDTDFAAVATITAVDATNRPVTAKAEAPVDVIHPALTVTNDATPAQVRAGDTVTFTIAVTNAGDVPLTDVSIADSRTPACAQTIGTLPPGALQRHSCTVTAGTDNFATSTTATGTDPTKRQVSATDDASYTVQHPALAITASTHGPFRQGDTVPFTITVTNTGDVPLTAIAVTGEPACAKKFDKLEPGAAQKYDCATTAPADDVVSTAKATATPPIGPPVTAETSATVDVIHPAVKLTKDPKPATVRIGDDVTFTITVTNTGDVPLTELSIVDEDACAKKFGSLAPQATQTYTCTRKAPDDDFTDPADVTGIDPTGRPVQATGDAKVDVVHPEIAVMKDAAPYEVRPGDTVTFSLLVKNTGDAPLTAVSVVDDHTPSCAHTAANLAADAEITYTCTTVAGKEGFTSKATVTAQDPTGRPVTASGEATFVVRSG